MVTKSFPDLALDQNGSFKFPLYWESDPLFTEKMGDDEKFPSELQAAERLLSLGLVSRSDLILLESQPMDMQKFLGNFFFLLLLIHFMLNC